MNIISAIWTSEAQATVRVETDAGAMFVSASPGNLEWEKVSAWVDAGNLIEDYTPPPAPPRTIAGAYFRAALTDLGHMTTVRSALTDPIDLELFNTASEFNDSAPDVNAVAAALSIDLSAVFNRAEAIRAARQA